MDWKNIRFAGLTALALIVALTAWQPATAQVIVVSGRGGFDGPNVGTVKLAIMPRATHILRSITSFEAPMDTSYACDISMLATALFY